jgi:pyrrolysine biosynthesis protein PylD
MTRLTSQDIRDIPAGLEAYDAELAVRIGCSLRALACRAVGLAEAELARLARGVRTAVVPMDGGQGVLPGFAEALVAIAARLGLEAWVTQPDVGGLAEAYEQDAGILLTADDARFVAVNLRTRAVSDNSAATARGFVTALELLAGGLGGREVLVLGCGPVGRAAARRLLERGAAPSLYDVRSERARLAASELRAAGKEIRVEEDLEQAMRRNRLLFDATPSPGFITERHITPATCVAAPGVPLGLSAGAVQAIGRRLVHDALEIGTAVMLLEALIP